MKTGRDHGNRRCPTKGATLHAGPNCLGRARWDLAVSSCPFIKLSFDVRPSGKTEPSIRRRNSSTGNRLIVNRGNYVCMSGQEQNTDAAEYYFNIPRFERLARRGLHTAWKGEPQPATWLSLERLRWLRGWKFARGGENAAGKLTAASSSENTAPLRYNETASVSPLSLLPLPRYPQLPFEKVPSESARLRRRTFVWGFIWSLVTKSAVDFYPYSVEQNNVLAVIVNEQGENSSSSPTKHTEWRCVFPFLLSIFVLSSFFFSIFTFFKVPGWPGLTCSRGWYRRSDRLRYTSIVHVLNKKERERENGGKKE